MHTERVVQGHSLRLLCQQRLLKHACAQECTPESLALVIYRGINAQLVITDPCNGSVNRFVVLLAHVHPARRST